MFGLRTISLRTSAADSNSKSYVSPGKIRIRAALAVRCALGRSNPSFCHGAPGEMNLIVRGDFNIEQRREDEPLDAAFISQGLTVPAPLRDV